jgi:hypothetical protein
MADVAAESTKVCGCEKSTFIKSLNFLCGIGMMVFGFFNIFGFLGAGAQVVLAFGFAMYQM